MWVWVCGCVGVGVCVWGGGGHAIDRCMTRKVKKMRRMVVGKIVFGLTFS